VTSSEYLMENGFHLLREGGNHLTVGTIVGLILAVV
jgi:hypothetical protein